MLLLLLGVIDALFIKEAWLVVRMRKRSVAIVFGLEVRYLYYNDVEPHPLLVCNNVDRSSEGFYEVYITQH